MKALRRVRQIDNIVSDYLLDACVQTFMAIQNEEISEEAGQALLCVFHRMHNSIMAKRGIHARDWQRRYNRKHRIQWDSELTFTLACVAAFGIALAAAWLITR